MAEEYMNVNEVRQLLGMPKYEFTEREEIAALAEYNKKNSTKIILVEE